ncbi:MAG: helix-turn-helix domain-containing protein [Lachnospiraceae bacterium]|nr:helix-turn-helix domain-containing protein [Lachnospiraceae bacterium]
MTVNERVKEIRKSVELTMEKFGERLGVGKVAISCIESGKNNVTEQMIKSICREFGYREEWLRDGVEPKKPEIDADIEYGQICAELGITDSRAKQIILNYGRFSPEDKKLFWSYIDRLCSTNNKAEYKEDSKDFQNGIDEQ